MKTSFTPLRSLLLVNLCLLFLLAAARLPAADVQEVLMLKGQMFLQTGTGATFSQPPAHLVEIQVQVDDNFTRVYNTDNLPTAPTIHTLASPVTWSPVTWSAVTVIHMVYNDTLGNHYVISFPRP